MLNVESARDLEVETQPFVLLKELVELLAARRLHGGFELAHPGQRE